jgi:hypothetical protein
MKALVVKSMRRCDDRSLSRQSVTALTAELGPGGNLIATLGAGATGPAFGRGRGRRRSGRPHRRSPSPNRRGRLWNVGRSGRGGGRFADTVEIETHRYEGCPNYRQQHEGFHVCTYATAETCGWPRPRRLRHSKERRGARRAALGRGRFALRYRDRPGGTCQCRTRNRPSRSLARGARPGL